MAVVLIPTFENAFYTTTTVLDGTPYLLEFRYNQREQSWYFSVGTSDGEWLVVGIKVVCGIGLSSRFADRRMPPGQIIAIDTTGQSSAPPTLLEMGDGKRVKLVYIEKVTRDLLRQNKIDNVSVADRERLFPLDVFLTDLL